MKWVFAMDAIDFGMLIRGITANVNSYISSNIEPLGIKQGQLDYFLLVHSNPGINQLEIGRQKNVGKASVTKALKILEDDGFIFREVDNEDRRNFKCYVTQKGHDIADTLIAIKAKAQSDLFYQFADTDQTTLYKLLVRLHRNSETLTKDAKTAKEV